MKRPAILAPYFSCLDSLGGLAWTGRVRKVVGQVVESDGPFCSVGESCEFNEISGHTLRGEVIGFRGTAVLSMPLASATGLRFGDAVISRGLRPTVGVSEKLLGRVLDGEGCPMDSLGEVHAESMRPLDGIMTQAMAREPITESLGCGVRAMDAFLTCGRGQRIGIFGGSGVGKSTLLGMVARHTEADLTVLALVGERGREVREFIEHSLGPEGLRRSVVVVSTSDQSPLLRIRAAHTATAIAEFFRDRGRHVLLVLDSLTRLGMAQREIGLAAGEPPTSKGYTPSVLTLMARMLERAGRFQQGSITGFYTVLMEGDDQQDPMVDMARSLLDGHIVLDRRLASENHYPPIAILDSVSRLMRAVVAPEHLQRAAALRALLATYRASEDLVRIGAYQKGGDLELDRALAVLPLLNSFLRQTPTEAPSLPESVAQLLAIPV